MPDVKLGNRHECSECGVKFYDLGKPRAACPKCGTVQKDNDAEPTARRSRKSPAAVKPAKTKPVVKPAKTKSVDDEDGEELDHEDGENGEELDDAKGTDDAAAQ